MKVVNLDKFKQENKVIIDGAEYIVKGMTVRQFLNNNINDKLNEAKDDAERVKAMVEVLRQISNIPEEKLLDLNFQALTALIYVAQGINPEEQESSEKK